MQPSHEKNIWYYQSFINYIQNKYIQKGKLENSKISLRNILCRFNDQNHGTVEKNKYINS